MLDFLKEVKSENFDAVFFVPGENENMVRVEGAKYKDPGESVGGNKMGDMYHIMLFKQDDHGNPVDPDLFEAILTEPLEYVSRMITCDFYGFVAKKTTTSGSFVDNTFDKIKELV